MNVQTTLPRNEADTEAGSGFERAYRSNFALLPPWEQVVDTMEFRKFWGEWLTSEIIERPRGCHKERAARSHAMKLLTSRCSCYYPSQKAVALGTQSAVSPNYRFISPGFNPIQREG